MDPATEITIFGIAIFIQLLGLVGMALPGVPGPLIIWLGALFYGAAVGFPVLGIIMFVIITLLMIAGSFVDNILMNAGARKGGASWVSLLLAAIAGLAGTIFFPPFGGLIAAPAVILIYEWFRLRNFKAALKAFTGWAAGWGLSFIARFGIGLLMIGAFLIWAFLRS